MITEIRKPSAAPKLKFVPTFAVAACFVLAAKSSEPVMAGQFDNEVEAAHRAVLDCQNQYQDLEFANQAVKQVAADDVPLAKKWFDALCARYQVAGDLFAQEKRADAFAAWNEAQSMGAQRFAWQARLYARQQQANAVPTEEWLTNQRGWTAPSVAPLLTALTEARKQAAQAWGQVAETNVPGVDPLRLAKAVDDANNAASQVGVADARLNWGRQMRDLLEKRSINPDVDAKVAAIEAVQNQMSQLILDRNLYEQKIRALDLEGTALDKARNEKFDQANAALGKAVADAQAKAQGAAEKQK